MLAEAVGVSFQQVQKYEEGCTNRISAGALYQLTITLEVPVQYFFDGLSGRRKKRGSRNRLSGRAPLGRRREFIQLLISGDSHGFDRPKALQRAVLVVMTDRQHNWVDPKYWAPLVIVGEPAKPLH